MILDDLFIEYNKLPRPLTKDEIYSYFKKIKKGDLKAREYVITHNIRLVVNEVCKKFGNTLYEKKELVSVGLVGLVKSVDTFDISRKYEFSTYAARCIDNEIEMFIRKEKKYIFDQSIDAPIGIDDEGNKKEIKDILEDVTADFVSEYMNEIVYNEIRKIVYDLPERDREIILLYFGFVNNQTYTQTEIAQKLNITQSYISKLIPKIVKKVGIQCEEKGIIQGKVRMNRNSTTIKQKLNNSNKIVNGKRKVMSKKLKTIYEYFNDYTRDEVNSVLSRLTAEELEIVRLRYGDDLEYPVRSPGFTRRHSNMLYNRIFPKMKELLKVEKSKKSLFEPEKHHTSKELELNSINNSLISQNINSIQLPNMNSEELVTEPDVTFTKSETIDKKDLETSYLTIQGLMKTPSFINMLNILNTKEAIIIRLLSYVDGKDFTIESIAQLLRIEQDEIRKIAKKVLTIYKENINYFIDNTIDVVNDKSLTLRKEK